jgi:NADP-dependent 3-hydroxy acid dehydrogenase YdfG
LAQALLRPRPLDPSRTTGSIGQAVTTSLAGKIALVTGASQGIGLAIATTLARSQMRVWMVGRRGGHLRQAADSICGDVVPFQADLTDPMARANLVAAVEKADEGLDVLVNNAGRIRLGRTEDASEEEFVDLLTINVVAPYALTRALLPLLRQARGDIVFVNSSAGRTANPGGGQYSATKHAARAFAESLRGEVNEDGVRVAVLYPGRTATPLQQALYEQEGRAYDPARLVQPTDVADMVMAVLNLPRTAEVTELAIRPMLKP